MKKDKYRKSVSVWTEYSKNYVLRKAINSYTEIDDVKKRRRYAYCIALKSHDLIMKELDRYFKDEENIKDKYKPLQFNKNIW